MPTWKIAPNGKNTENTSVLDSVVYLQCFARYLLILCVTHAARYFGSFVHQVQPAGLLRLSCCALVPSIGLYYLPSVVLCVGSTVCRTVRWFMSYCILAR